MSWRPWHCDMTLKRGWSDINDQSQNGTEARVFVWTSPKLASKALLSAYNWGLKGFHFGDLLFYSLFLSILSKNGHKLSEILKIGSKIKVHQNENPLNPSYKHSKVHYWPILVVFRQKLWPQSHFGPVRRYPISPFNRFKFQADPAQSFIWLLKYFCVEMICRIVKWRQVWPTINFKPIWKF